MIVVALRVFHIFRVEYLTIMRNNQESRMSVDKPANDNFVSIEWSYSDWVRLGYWDQLTGQLIIT